MGRTIENLEKAADELKQYDVNVAFAAADVADLDGITKAVETIRAELEQCCYP